MYKNMWLFSDGDKRMKREENKFYIISQYLLLRVFEDVFFL